MTEVFSHAPRNITFCERPFEMCEPGNHLVNNSCHWHTCHVYATAHPHCVWQPKNSMSTASRERSWHFTAQSTCGPLHHSAVDAVNAAFWTTFGHVIRWSRLEHHRGRRNRTAVGEAEQFVDGVSLKGCLRVHCAGVDLAGKRS